MFDMDTEGDIDQANRVVELFVHYTIAVANAICEGDRGKAHQPSSPIMHHRSWKTTYKPRVMHTPPTGFAYKAQPIRANVTRPVTYRS